MLQFKNPRDVSDPPGQFTAASFMQQNGLNNVEW